VDDFALEKFLDERHFNRYGRAAQFTASAAKMAVEDASGSGAGGASAVVSYYNADIGVTVGLGGGEMQAIEYVIEKKLANERIEGEEFRKCFPQNVSVSVSDALAICGGNVVISTACSAGNDAIIHAYTKIKNGKLKAMLACGVDVFSKIAYIGFSRLNAIAERECAPFDANRSGTMVAEGVGVLLLESYEDAVARGAHIYADVLGFGTSCDAHHITAADPSKRGGMYKAMRQAITSAKLAPEDIDYICAHGTGTKANDSIETAAIKDALGKRAYDIPVSSIKSMIGHSGGGAGVLGAIACVMSITNGRVPPTIGYKTPDPECDLDYVPNKSREASVKVALNNAFAFGGNNTCVAIGKL
jgi:3-oxoacyl-[acyl-carrier-protein] synthase II